MQCWGDSGYGGTSLPVAQPQVSAASGHSCAVDTRGVIQCWGDDTHGQATAPEGSFRQVSTGTAHTCAVDTSGSVQCWGDDSAGQATPQLDAFTQVTAGGSHSCGRDTTGGVQCWGEDSDGQATPPAGTFILVSAGLAHTCALNEVREIECWGDNTSDKAPPRRRLCLGQCGVGSHLRGGHRRGATVLGRRQLRPGEPAGRNLPLCLCRRKPQLCHERQWHRGVLGRRQQRPDECFIWLFYPVECRRGSHLRAERWQLQYEGAGQLLGR
jgi:hypothetical protein